MGHLSHFQLLTTRRINEAWALSTQHLAECARTGDERCASWARGWRPRRRRSGDAPGRALRARAAGSGAAGAPRGRASRRRSARSRAARQNRQATAPSRATADSPSRAPTPACAVFAISTRGGSSVHSNSTMHYSPYKYSHKRQQKKKRSVGLTYDVWACRLLIFQQNVEVLTFENVHRSHPSEMKINAIFKVYNTFKLI